MESIHCITHPSLASRALLRAARAGLAASAFLLAGAAHAEDVVVVPQAAPVVTPPPVVVAQPTTQVTSETRTILPNPAMFATGAITLAGFYGASVIVASQSDNGGDRHLYVPLVGPWLDMADRQPCGGATNRSCDSETTNKVLLAGDGVFQAVGTLLLIGSFLSPEKRVETTTAAKVTVAPQRYGKSGYGLVLGGSF